MTDEQLKAALDFSVRLPREWYDRCEDVCLTSDGDAIFEWIADSRLRFAVIPFSAEKVSCAGIFRDETRSYETCMDDPTIGIDIGRTLAGLKEKPQ